LHRGKKKNKPAALTPRPNSATQNAKGQAVAKGQAQNQKPSTLSPPAGTQFKAENSKNAENHVDKSENWREWGKDPP
jgi:hypothetical protein